MVKKTFAVLLSISVLVTLASCSNSIKNQTTDRNISSINSDVTDSASLRNHSSNKSSTSIESTAQTFIKSLKDTNARRFNNIVSDAGMIFIRNFVSGNGARGTDIRNYYKVSDIPKHLTIQIKGQSGIDLKSLFLQSMHADKSNIHIVNVNNPIINFTDNGSSDNYAPSTDELMTELSSIVKNCYNSPVIYNLHSKEFILSESQVIDNLPMGSFAIFVNKNGTFKLRAVIDFE